MRFLNGSADLVYLPFSLTRSGLTYPITLSTIRTQAWDSPGDTRRLDQAARSRILLSTLQTEKVPKVKMFINTQGPKRKEPTTHESAGEDAASLLFSRCE